MKFLVTHADGSTRIIEAPNAGLARLPAVEEAMVQHGIVRAGGLLHEFDYFGWDWRVLISSAREVPNEKERSA